MEVADSAIRLTLIVAMCRCAEEPLVPVSVRQQSHIDDSRALVRWLVTTRQHGDSTEGITNLGDLAKRLNYSPPELSSFMS
eukprot:5271018-Prymnesium_polylepis.1